MSLNPETLPGELTHASLYAGTFTTNTSGTGALITGYKGKLFAVLNAAAAANDNQAATVVIETSDELSANYAALSPAVEFAAIAANGAAQVQAIEIDTRTAKAYVRATLTRAAAGNGRVISVTIGGKRLLTS